MQASEFTSESPGRLVPAEHGALAFVPNPPPERLTLSGSTLASLTRAERALGQLTGTLRAAGRHVNPQLVNAPLAREEAIASSRIEGTNTTPEQLVLLELDPPGHQPEELDRAQTREVLTRPRRGRPGR
jgi:Fic family protein